jgi:hypothetical protein
MMEVEKEGREKEGIPCSDIFYLREIHKSSFPSVEMEIINTFKRFSRIS